MVKKLLGTLSLGLLLSTAASAQVFTLSPNDTIEVTTSGQGEQTQEGFNNTLNIEGHINNISSAERVFRWKLLSDSTEHPAGWIVTGICDNFVCRLPYSAFYYHVEQETLPVAAGGNSLLEARLYCPPPTGNGTGVIRIQVRALDVADTNIVMQQDTLVIIVHKNPTGIGKITSDDKRVALYPNPATDNIQVYADKTLNPAQITVMNVAGVQQAVKNIEKGKDVTNLNLGSLAAGLYMIRVTDINGTLITTRKFAKR
jgi:hypothetical protein